MKPKRILVMGLPGSGKTYVSKKLAELLGFKHLEADAVRKEFNDWDFSEEGRLRQAKRMRSLADEAIGSGVGAIADFVCPTEETRTIFEADIVIWLDTIKASRFADTNSVFTPPTKADYRIDEFKEGDYWAEFLYKKISKK